MWETLIDALARTIPVAFGVALGWFLTRLQAKSDREHQVSEARRAERKASYAEFLSSLARLQVSAITDKSPADEQRAYVNDFTRIITMMILTVEGNVAVLIEQFAESIPQGESASFAKTRAAIKEWYPKIKIAMRDDLDLN